MSNIVKWTPNLAVSRRIEEALEVVKENAPAIRREDDRRPFFSRERHAVRETAQPLPSRVAMPRVCALVDKYYASYYMLGSNGRYRYSRSGQIDKAVFRQLYSGVGVGEYRMRAADIDEETCPWCGTSGRSGVYCSQCHTFTCWGSTVDNRFWSCRASCGNSSELVNVVVEHIALIPKTGF